MKFKIYIITLALFLFTTLPAEADTVIIVHPSFNDEVSKKDIARVFLGKEDFLTAYNLKESDPIRKEFTRKLLRKSTSQLKSYWAKRSFTGKGKPPKEFLSDEQMKQKVASDPNAIGYIHKSKVDASVKVALVL